MPVVEGCKYEVELTIPVEEITRETEAAEQKIQKQVHMPGFRPGKAPMSVVRTRFQQDIQKQVLDHVIPKALDAKAEEDKVRMVSRANVTDLHFHAGEPLRFKAEFEIAPSFELGDYRGMEVEYKEPEVADAEIDERLNGLRESKAEYVNEDPRPVGAGDHVVVSIRSVAGVEGDAVQSDGLALELGSPDTMPEFTENLTGLTPGDEKEFDVTYPEDYGQKKLAGRKVTFHAVLKQLRRKELPELDDDFAQSIRGDLQTLGELREEIRRSLFREAENSAQQKAKTALVDKLIDAHSFAVPEVWVDQQIRSNLEEYLSAMAMQGIDVSKMDIQWDKVRESTKDRAAREVRGSLILERVAERESIGVMNDEIDREIQRVSRQTRQPMPVIRDQWQKDGTMGRLVSRIKTEKTLAFLFDNARKVAAAE